MKKYKLIDGGIESVQARINNASRDGYRLLSIESVLVKKYNSGSIMAESIEYFAVMVREPTVNDFDD